MHRRTTYFCMFLNLTNLLNSFISSNWFLWTLGFYTCKIMSSMKRNNFTSSFSMWMPFNSFSHLIALSRTSNTMLNRCDKSSHPCLVPGFKRKAFHLSPFNMMLTMSLSYIYEIYFVEVVSLILSLFIDLYH